MFILFTSSKLNIPDLMKFWKYIYIYDNHTIIITKVGLFNECRA